MVPKCVAGYLKDLFYNFILYVNCIFDLFHRTWFARIVGSIFSVFSIAFFSLPSVCPESIENRKTLK